MFLFVISIDGYDLIYLILLPYIFGQVYPQTDAILEDILLE